LSHKSLIDARVWELFRELDRDLIEEVVGRGCPCGGRLHRADFGRKPRGPGLPEDRGFSIRFSACCDREGCRSRATPPSVRFLGRKVYLGVIVVLVSALRQGPTPQRMRVLREELGVERRTVQRWARWWREEFAGSRLFRLVKSRLVGVGAEVPRSIVDHLDGWKGGERLLAVLRLLAPLGQSGRLPDLVW
jgi:hypothetical protein